jgi:hypothetical protein
MDNEEFPGYLKGFSTFISSKNPRSPRKPGKKVHGEVNKDLEAFLLALSWAPWNSLGLPWGP